MDEAISDFLSIPSSNWAIGTTTQAEAVIKRESRLRELNFSLQRANEVLREHGAGSIRFIPFDCQYHIGTAVKTRFGMGIITRFRSSDGIYEVSLCFDSDKQKFIRAYMIASELSLVSQKGAKGLLTSIALPNMKDSKTRLRPSNNINGAMIWSPYGLATVLYHRPTDDCMVVKTSWGATCYLRRKGKFSYVILSLKLQI